jgi:hypothetical protein
MNQVEVVSVIVMVVVSVSLHFATRALMPRLRPVLRPWLDPIVHSLFPSTKLEPWLFERIEGPDLPPWQREFFNANTPPFLSRRYEHLGDFVIRRDREPSCVRLFLSPDRTILGELSCFLGQRVIGGMSVLYAGTYIETSTSRVESPPPLSHGLQFFHCGSKNVLELLDHHALCVAGVAQATGSQPTVLEPADYKAVMNYGRELSFRSLHAQGIMEELPEFLKRQDAAAQHTNPTR